MNRITPMQWGLVALTVLVLAGGTYAWFHFMEKRWLAIPHQSVETLRNPLLAAERLLATRGYDARADLTLPLLLQQGLTPGTVMLTDNRGMVTVAQAEALLAWVADGNTLIVRPQWAYLADDDDEAADEEAITELVERDPIGVWFGVNQTSRPVPDTASSSDANADAKNPAPADDSGKTDTDSNANGDGKKDGKADKKAAKKSTTKPAKRPIEYAHVQLPNAPHELLIRRNYSRLINAEDGPDPALTDATGETIQIFAEGDGHVVFLASEPFTNQSIGAADHAELLLALVALGDNGKSVRFITELDMPAWYDALWQHFRWALIGAAVVLLTWLWRAVVRFGPLQAEPDPARRAQLEHVQASARWLWRLSGGREQLLTAVRTDVEAVLLRHLPSLRRLPEAARHQQIAEHCALPLADVVFALQAPAAQLPVDFTRQIHLLQLMRQTHERTD